MLRSRPSALLLVATASVAFAAAVPRDAWAAPEPLGGVDEPPALEVSLDEAVSRALVHSPTLVQARGVLRVAAAGERSALGAYLPSLSAEASGSLAAAERFDPVTNRTVLGSADSYFAGVTARWDLFTGLRRGAQRAAAAAFSEGAEAQAEQERFAVAFAVERAFYDVLRAAELMEVAQARIARAEKGLSAAERRASVGSATQSDVLRARLELNTAQDELLQQTNVRRTAAYALGHLVGADGPATPRSSEVLAPPALGASDELVLEELVSGAPAVAAAQSEVGVSSASVRSALSAYSPTAGVSAGYDWFNSDPGHEGWETGWSVRLGVSLPIFDGFRREEAVTRARVDERTARARLADVRREVRATFARLLGEVRLQEQRIELAEQAVQVAEEDLRVQQERYAIGMTTILDLLASQTALAEAQSGRIEARFTARLARAELDSVAGKGAGRGSP